MDAHASEARFQRDPKRRSPRSRAVQIPLALTFLILLIHAHLYVTGRSLEAQGLAFASWLLLLAVTLVTAITDDDAIRSRR